MNANRYNAGRYRRPTSNDRMSQNSPSSASYSGRRGASYGATPASFGEERLSNPYSRRVTQADYTRQRKKKKRKTIALVALAVVLVLVLGGAGVAFAYLQTINSNLHKGVTEELKGALVDTQYAGDPFYMLLMGTDGSEERASGPRSTKATISAPTA